MSLNLIYPTEMKTISSDAKSKKKLNFISAFLRMRDDTKRVDIAKDLGYTSAAGLNILFSKCDDMNLSMMYHLFELMGAELEIDLRNENDPPTNASKDAFPKEKQNVRPLLAAMRRYNKTLKELALNLGLFERTLSYYAQKGDITFSKLCDIAYAEGWSIFITIKENRTDEGDNRFHVRYELGSNSSLEALTQINK